MSKTTYRVKEVARIAKVTVRTLHHYDEIGLLRPSERTAAGYRLYRDGDLLRLQQIRLQRELGLSLEAIRLLLDDPAHDARRALLEQRALLVERGRCNEAMIRAVDAALARLQGDREMDARRLFDGFDPADHEDEARRRWGKTDPYREAARRTRGYSPEDWVAIQAEADGIVARFADKLADGAGPADAAVLALAEEHRRHIDRWYYPCSPMMHAGLAGMYVADERFRATFDRHGEGLAAFVAEAIRANAALTRATPET